MDRQQSPTRSRTAVNHLIEAPDPASLLSICQVMTVHEVARELRCSKAHVHHLITGKVCGVRPLPSLWLGRRRLILRASFDEWLRANERYPG